ncbi:MAG: NapC/NirT family cytochrome c [Pseudolabrys sp.]
MIGSDFLNCYTSTNAFCTSCHSMKYVGNDPHFIHSAHRSNALGVRPNCGDCHIVKTNWFDETWDHVKSGLRDTIGPASTRGIAAHALMREGRMTCIDCHFNLVHAPVPPTIEFPQFGHRRRREIAAVGRDIRGECDEQPTPHIQDTGRRAPDRRPHRRRSAPSSPASPATTTKRCG